LEHLEIHGHRLAYRTAGDRGPVLILLHGMAGSSRTWEPALARLGARFRVVAPDLPGHGETDKPADGDYSLGALASSVRDLMVALGHRRATVVGQSLGGGVAMQFAYQFPERCERLVLVGSGGLGREVSPLLRALAFPGVEYASPLLFASWWREAGRGVLGALRRVGLRPSAHADEIWRSYESLTDPVTRAAFLRTLHAVVGPGGQSVSAHDRLGLASSVPTLIVWGTADGIIPVQHAHAAHAALPESRLELFEGVGHFPHCEAPDRFAEVLTDFVTNTEPSAFTEDDLARVLTRRMTESA
jgi:pimeloyl-ACP methyl ester carboxylesterase